MAISGSDPVNDLNQALFVVRRPPGGDTRSGDVATSSAGKTGDIVALSSEFKEREAVVNQIQALPDVRVDQLSSIPPSMGVTSTER